MTNTKRKKIWELIKKKYGFNSPEYNRCLFLEDKQLKLLAEILSISVD